MSEAESERSGDWSCEEELAELKDGLKTTTATEWSEKSDNSSHDSSGPSTSAEHCNPVDTGWSWMIMTSTFLIQLVCVGMLRSYGVIFVAIQIHFDTTASTVAAIGSIEAVSFSVVAFMNMAVLMKTVSSRRCILIGSSVGFFGLVLSSFMTSVWPLFATFSVCMGTAMGLTLPSCLAVLMSYFKKRLPLAVSVVSTGAAIGGVFTPFITRLLLDHFCLSGCFLLLAGLLGQNFVFSILLTPPSEYKLRGTQEGDELRSEEEMRMLEIQKQIIIAKSMRKSRKGVKSWSESYLEDCKPEADKEQTVTVPLANGLKFKSQEQLEVCIRQELQWTLNRQLSSSSMLLMSGSLEGSYRLSLSGIQLDARESCDDRLSLQNTERTPEDEDDAGKDRDPQDQTGCQLWRRKAAGVCDPGLCGSAVFWLLLLHHYTGAIGSLLPGAYLPFLARDKGLSVTQGALLVTISGAADIAFRVAPGGLVQMKLLRSHTPTVVSLFVLGAVFQFTSLLQGMPLMSALAVVHGVLAGVFPSMLSLILVDLCHVDQFHKVFGVMQLALGTAGVTGFPIIGYLGDRSGSYITAFNFMGACGLCSAVLLFVITKLHSRDMRRNREGSVVVETLVVP